MTGVVTCGLCGATVPPKKGKQNTTRLHLHLESECPEVPIPAGKSIKEAVYDKGFYQQRETGVSKV